MSRDLNDDPIFAEFFDDRPDATVDGGFPYLVAVQDPISSSAYGSTYSGHGHGLSQKGASRWARGNRWYNINTVPGEPWSVAWQDRFQILSHYYTDVHARDANAGNQILTTDYRWNALQINNLPPSTVTPNSPRTLSVSVDHRIGRLRI